ncbi:MAG TPA: urease accessory protein UreE [Kiritimatiellia bacterium]|nr:urease accessory protein UreE [Kiritimatiellia bacterium]HMP95471.1 urease accessory protein UreE [Kiritimatiellia bacterium]
MAIRADRWQLAKLRWRATAEDGREFGFELETPLQHGHAVWENYDAVYVIAQDPEDVLVIPLPEIHRAAAIAWAVGNLHQPLQVTDAELVTEDDGAVRHLLDDQGIAFSTEQRIFQPLRAVVTHHHHD